MQALRIQTNLNKATSKMNTAMERMSSGSKINSAKDDAAGLAVSTKLGTTISSSKVASNNVAIGSNLLDTAEGTLTVVNQNLQRVRDLTDQAANGTYSSTDLTAISTEVTARISEINTLAATIKSGISSATAAFLGTAAGTIDAEMDAITTRITNIGAAQNQLQAVSDGLTVQQTNLSAAKSTITDADVAQESATYVQQQILQQASASLLVQANSAPQIALTLIKG